MRRLLTILLLVLLPLQASWATVMSYCTHETQAVGDHLGHHEHRHLAEPGKHGDGGAAAHSAPSSAADTDCGHCHGNCASLLADVDAVAPAMSPGHPRSTVDDSTGAHAPSRPERPQWVPLA